MRAEIVDKGIVIDIRGKFAKGGGFGRVAFAYNYFGFYSVYSGIYQKKYYYDEVYISKMKFYRPTNPQTVDQQNWRDIFKDAMSAWSVLNDETKEIYRLKGARRKMSGMNIYVSEYLKSHRL